MGCERYREPREGRGVLSAYFDGELDDGGSFERHLESCQECRDELADLRRVSQLLALDDRVFASDPNFVARFRLRIDQSLGAPAELWRWVALRLLPVSLATLAAAVLMIVLDRQGVEPFSDLEQAVLALSSPTVGELAAQGELTLDPLASPMALRAPRSPADTEGAGR